MVQKSNIITLEVACWVLKPIIHTYKNTCIVLQHFPNPSLLQGQLYSLKVQGVIYIMYVRSDLVQLLFLLRKKFLSRFKLIKLGSLCFYKTQRWKSYKIGIPIPKWRNEKKGRVGCSQGRPELHMKPSLDCEY